MPAYLSLLEASKRSKNELFQGLAKNLISRDQLAALVPFRTFAGQQMHYLREGVRATTGFINDAGSNMQAPTTTTYDAVSVPMRQIASDTDVDTYADVLSGGTEMSRQVASKTLSTWDLVRGRIVRGGNVTSHTLGQATNPFNAIDAIGYGPWLSSTRYGPGELEYVLGSTSWRFRAPGDPAFGDLVPMPIADGTITLKSYNPSRWITLTLDISDATQSGRTYVEFASTTDEFDGLNKVCAPSQVRAPQATDGDVLTLRILNELLREERVRKNRVLIMSGGMLLRYLDLVAASPGMAPENFQIEGYGGQTHTYRGVPILECDEILDNETVGATSTCSSIYCASLDVDDGLFLGVPGTGFDAYDIEGDPRSRVVMGFHVEQLGGLEAMPRHRSRVHWAGALGLRNSLALTRARGIKLTGT